MRSLQRSAIRVSIVLLPALTFGFSLHADPSDASSDPSSDTAFHQVLESYETARLTLTQDSQEGVAAQAQRILEVLEKLAADWSADAAGIRPETADEVRSLLPELIRAAKVLATADSLAGSRDAFYAISKPLVRWRKAAAGERPVVVYCPMSRRSWLQEEGELGNPYHGQAMPRCGEVVDG